MTQSHTTPFGPNNCRCDQSILRPCTTSYYTNEIAEDIPTIKTVPKSYSQPRINDFINDPSSSLYCNRYKNVTQTDNICCNCRYFQVIL